MCVVEEQLRVANAISLASALCVFLRPATALANWLSLALALAVC